MDRSSRSLTLLRCPHPPNQSLCSKLKGAMKMWLDLHAKLSSHPVGDPIKPNLKTTREVQGLPCCAWSQQVNNGHWSWGLSVCLGLGGRDLSSFFNTSLDFILQTLHSVTCSCENTNLKAIIFDIFENWLSHFIHIYMGGGGEEWGVVCLFLTPAVLQFSFPPHLSLFFPL